LGIAIMIVLQAVINMGVASGVLPVTGQPLPVISRGGSSLLINCAYFGMILSVSRYAEKISNPDANVEQLATKNESDEYFSQENMS
jgi:cell division protein FtsW